MPTQNPRLTVTLEPSIAARLRRVSELTGNSQGSMVADILSQSAPVFDRLIKLLEAAEVAQVAAREEAASRLEKAQVKIEKQLGLMLDWMDESSRPLLDQAESVSRRRRYSGGKGAPLAGDRARRRGTAVASPTPLSNRGVRSETQKPGKQALARVPRETNGRSISSANPLKKPLVKSTVKRSRT